MECGGTVGKMSWNGQIPLAKEKIHVIEMICIQMEFYKTEWFWWQN